MGEVLLMDVVAEASGAVRFKSRFLSNDVQRRVLYYARTRDAAMHVLANMGRPVRLDEVAARAGMTACAFSRYFVVKTGITFTALVRTLRIEHAIDELERTDSAISDLAELTGYQSCCSFSKVFKEVTGKTPSEYRRGSLFGDQGNFEP